MPKHIDAVKSFDQFRAPWETEAGTDAEIDKAKLKRYIYGLVTDKAKAQDTADAATEAQKAAETERDTAKDEAAKASPDEANRKIERLEKKVADLTSERDVLVREKEHSDLRSEVLQGLDPKYAKYVTGDTREELEKSLADVKADFGLEDGDDGDREEEGEDAPARTRPRPNLRNGGDPNAGKDGDAAIDYEKVAADIVGGGIFG